MATDTMTITAYEAGGAWGCRAHAAGLSIHREAEFPSKEAALSEGKAKMEEIFGDYWIITFEH